MQHTYTATIDLDLVFATVEVAATRFSEALTRRQIDKAIAPIQSKLEKECAALFRRQSGALLAKLGKLRHYFRESAAEDFDDLFDSATLNTSMDMMQSIDTAISSAVLSGGKMLIRDFKASINFSLTNPRAVAYTRDKAAESISGIDAETKDVVRRILVTGIENGDSYSSIAKQIKDRYTQFAIGVPQQHIRSRAELIAVTEVGNAYQAGNLIAAQEMRENGLKMQKSWLTSNDERVSDGCKENAAQSWIDVNKAHASGHMTPLRFPGCRCTELYRRKP